MHVNVTWVNNTDNATGFAIERSDDNGSSWNQIATVPVDALTYSDYGVVNSHPNYRVFAFNDSMRSVYSNILGLTFTITSISPVAGIIGTHPTAVITGTNLGSSSSTQITAVHFRDPLLPGYDSISTAITPIDSTHIKVIVPDAPSGPQIVDVIIDDGLGNTAELSECYTYFAELTITKSGDTAPITVTIESPPPLDLTHTDDTTIVYIDVTGTPQNIPIDNIEETETSIVFIIPSLLPYPLFPQGVFVPLDIYVVGDGTQFSGSILLGTLNVYIADSSGIYILDTDQTSDLLYLRFGYTTDINLLMLSDKDDESDNNDDFSELLQYSSGVFIQDDIDEEEDDILVTSILLPSVAIVSVKIPDPYIKTAFLP